MRAHQCLVIPPDESLKTVLASTLRLLDAGRKVLVVHGGAVEGAQLELALLQALGGPSVSLLLLHRSGSHEEFADALAALERVEGRLEVLLLQGDGATDSLDSRLVTLLSSDAHDWSLTCLYESDQALGAALGEVVAHEHLSLTARELHGHRPARRRSWAHPRPEQR